MEVTDPMTPSSMLSGRWLLALAFAVLVLNVLVLGVLYSVPMPDPSVLPGRAPLHDIQSGRP